MRNINSTHLYNWFEEVWNKGQRNAIANLLTEEFVSHGLGVDGQYNGINGFLEFYDDFRRQFANVHVDIEAVLGDEDMESAFCRVTATHIESGKEVTFSGIAMAKIKDGKIEQAWNSYDFLTMYQQLGHSLTPPQ
ncbi:ester cyclase [Solitalea sp. MAHUQ-68]|uniref:Ester cyclase n=1 Tax=Solitalea agri TaxID=2953739 RepID=A0A9X2F1Z5_9SPHI|nr:ester cyclase [Solitalea agri]MCO4293192.1 ester cyclase [Solitalea agri]